VVNVYLYLMVILIKLVERHITQRKPTLVNVGVIEGMYRNVL